MQLALPRITALNATVVAISPQTQEHTLSTVEKNNLTFEVLSDPGNVVAKQFRIAFRLPAELRPVYKGFGIDLQVVNGDDLYELPLSATYLLDQDRKIRLAYLDTDYTRRLDPEDMLAALAAMAG